MNVDNSHMPTQGIARNGRCLYLQTLWLGKRRHSWFLVQRGVN